MLEKVVRVKGQFFQIIGNGLTVWVNGPDGGSVARFNNSIDIHKPSMEQSEDDGPCLFCTHTPATADDWTLFVQKMEELYGVKIPDTFKPDRFKCP
jgi:hypothetical protein